MLLDGVELAGRTARGISLDEVSETDFRGATLRRCDARGCELQPVRGVDRLRGLSMPWAEIVANADVWASALGIGRIED